MNQPLLGGDRGLHECKNALQGIAHCPAPTTQLVLSEHLLCPLQSLVMLSFLSFLLCVTWQRSPVTGHPGCTSCEEDHAPRPLRTDGCNFISFCC